MSVAIEIENIAGNASKNHNQKVKQTNSTHISSDIFLNLKVCHFKTVRSLGMEHNIEKELLEAPDAGFHKSATLTFAVFKGGVHRSAQSHD